MKCPFCGYELSPIDPDCPRCLATEQREAALDAPRFRNPRIEVNDLPRATTPQVIDRSKIPAIAEVLRKGSLLLYVLCGALFLTSFFLPWFSLLDYIHASFTGQGEAREFFCLAALGAMGLALFEVKRKWPCLRYARLVLTGSCLTFAIWQLSELLPCSGQLRVELGLPLMIGGAAAMALLDVVSLPSKIIAIACVPLSILGIQSLSNRAETGGRHKMVVYAQCVCLTVWIWGDGYAPTGTSDADSAVEVTLNSWRSTSYFSLWVPEPGSSSFVGAGVPDHYLFCDVSVISHAPIAWTSSETFHLSQWNFTMYASDHHMYGAKMVAMNTLFAPSAFPDGDIGMAGPFVQGQRQGGVLIFQVPENVQPVNVKYLALVPDIVELQDSRSLARG